MRTKLRAGYNPKGTRRFLNFDEADLLQPLRDPAVEAAALLALRVANVVEKRPLSVLLEDAMQARVERSAVEVGFAEGASRRVVDDHIEAAIRELFDNFA